MPVRAAANPNYVNAANVSDKYNPLNNVVLTDVDQALYSAMLTNRWGVLHAVNLLPQPLHLAMPSWDDAIAAEVGKSPPLVVVSSNRSGWIAEGIAAAEAKLTALDIDNFDNVRDLRALQTVADHSVSPPIYCPKRLGPAPLTRNVYIVVHTSEYETYKTALAGSGITPVGWQFNAPAASPYGHPLAGFGVTRFAAVQFCKELRTRVAAGGGAVWNKAWVVDDNTVALEEFPGLVKVEGRLLATDYAVAFRGADTASTRVADLTWANDNVGETTTSTGPATKGGLLQQFVLWNIELMTDNHLNFPPAFMASAEDVSLSNYLGKAARIYKNIRVRKEVTTYDNTLGATAVQQAKQTYEAAFANAESRTPPNGPLPARPVQIQNDGDVSTVQAFIDANVLPLGPWSKRKKAACQAVEEITKRAIGKAGFVSAAALTNTFQINGAGPQAVVRSDLP